MRTHYVETNTTGWSAAGGGSIAQSSDCAAVGDYSLKVTPGAGVWDGTIWNGLTLVNGETYIASAWVKGEPGVTYYIGLYDTIEAAYVGSLTQFTGTGEWQRVATTAGAAAGNNLAYLYIRKYNDASTDVYYVDGVQIEQKAYETSYCDGAQGTGYAWSGTAHGSTSTRTLTEANLDAHANVVSANDTFSVRIVTQAPHDSTVTWSSPSHPFLWCIYGADVNNYVYLRFVTGSGFALYINGANRIVESATFSQGDWLDIVITFDFTNDDYRLYLNGELLGSDDTSLTAPVVTQMNLGAIYNATYPWGGAFAEFAVFDKALTQVEVSELHNYSRPLVDAGAMETPGIYITDGKFQIASSTSGNRIEMTAEEIAGYNAAGTKQFYLRSSDGAAACGGGDVWFNSAGMNIRTYADMGTWKAIDLMYLDGATWRDLGSIFGNYRTADDAGLVYLAAWRYAGDPWDEAHVVVESWDDVTGANPLLDVSTYADGISADPNLGVMADAEPWPEDFGGGRGILGISNADTVPTSSCAWGHIVYAQSGALKGRGSSGTITTIAPAEPICPVCGRDFVLEWNNEEAGTHLLLCTWCLAEALQDIAPQAILERTGPEKVTLHTPVPERVKGKRPTSPRRGRRVFRNERPGR